MGGLLGECRVDNSELNAKNMETRVKGLCSVVCTTYNHAKYSRAAIESIASQDFRPIEIVIVDDGSTDDNVAVIRAALSESGLPHTLITQNNTGNVAVNANRALAAARGEFVVLTSLDDLLLPGCISSKMEIMLAGASLVMVGNSANSETDDAGTITILESRNPIFGKEMATAEEMLDLEFSNIHSFFLQGTAFRADFLTAVGAFDENCVGDDLILRTKIWLHLIAHPDLRFAFLRRPGFAYRKHALNQHHNGSRQLRTVLEWRNRYFPNRPMPDLAQRWACSYFNQLLARRDYYALNEMLASDPQLMGIFENYRKTWKFRRRAIKNFVKRMLGHAHGSSANS